MRRLVAAFVVAAVPAAAAAQTSFPMVTHSTPTAVQRGTTAEVVVACKTSSLAGAYQVLIEGTGVSADVVAGKDAAKPDPKGPVPVVPQVTLRVAVAPEAACGVREFR